MGKTREYARDMRYTASMPKQVYDDIKGLDNVSLFGGYDAGMFEYYQKNAQWQEAEYEYKQARSKKKIIESEIDFKYSTK